MPIVFLAAFIGGVLLAVRLMFYGAERRPRHSTDTLPLRRWEPAIISFLVVFGVAGYVVTRNNRLSASTGGFTAAAVGVICAVILTRLAIAAARFQPEHDPDDVRFLLQGRVGVVTAPIPCAGEGMISYDSGAAPASLRAREIDGGAVATGVEICIDHLDGGVAVVELWARVEARL